MPVNIHGAEYPIKKIFSNDFVFSIPLYQRPYAWETEQAGELLEDLLAFMGETNDPIDELEPYFLGSIVLIKGDGPEADVVDGQQRLTTLTILLAALRSRIPEKYANAITPYLYEQGDPILGTSNRYRLKVRSLDAEFFQKHIEAEGAILKLADLKDALLPTDSQKNMRDNGLHFLKKLDELEENRRVRLVQFIIMRCFMVVVSTPDLDSAYRIFSVLNDRGMDLSHSDILKSELIGKVPEAQRAVYNSKWESKEVDLGREAFRNLFAHIRMIAVKRKPQKALLKEFGLYVLKKDTDPCEFIDNVLLPYAEAYDIIKNTNHVSTAGAEQVNDLLTWLNRINNADWVPSAILFYSTNKNNQAKLVKFFTDLERLAAGMMIYGTYATQRMERYGLLLNAIENGDDLYTPDSPLQLKPKEKSDILYELNGDLYQHRTFRLYVLLRLDAALSEGTASYNYPILTVEHILPQNPAANSKWLEWFPDAKEREGFTHQLGNLALLSRRKNSSASNYEFSHKKDQYFSTAGGVTPFVLTNQVIHQIAWTPEIIQQRQQQLVSCLKSLWRLD